MEKKKLCLALYTGSVDELTAAGVIIGGAAAEDMDVEIFVLLQTVNSRLKKDLKRENNDN